MTAEQRTYTWDGPGAPVVEDVATIESVDRTMEELLLAVPNGSTIVWKDPAVPASHPFATLPSIKLGPDEFAAHGLTPDRNRFARVELVAALRAVTGGRDEDGPVFVTRIDVLEHF